ncbi:hypothetical protein [Actinoallomurus sp. CA-150999]|uniref:hypothetical protein n=1 Tax=Actinoallomurus sp. CA-150999 TaxID=3239887 RepID=UPI003D8DE13F
MNDPTSNPRPDEDSLVRLDRRAGYVAGRRDALAEQAKTPAVDWRLRYARETLEASRTAPAERDQAALWWGKTEAALEALLQYVDEQAGRA